jgi:hypothetical protein
MKNDDKKPSPSRGHDPIGDPVEPEGEVGSAGGGGLPGEGGGTTSPSRADELQEKLDRQRRIEERIEQGLPVEEERLDE